MFSRVILSSALLLVATVSAHAAPLLLEATVAKVGREVVTVSDLVRYHEVDAVLRCADLRKGAAPLGQDFSGILNVYVEEELIYAEARAKKTSSSGSMRAAIEAIQRKSACLKQWQEQGKRSGRIWSTAGRPREGEAMLVRELEKRLTVDNYIKDKIPGDRSIWIREARVRVPVKLFLD